MNITNDVILASATPEEAPFNKIVNGEPVPVNHEKVECNKDRCLRRKAAKMGLVVKKSRRKHATDTDKGLYGLFNLSGNAIAGATYNL